MNPTDRELPAAWVLRTGHGTAFHDGTNPPVEGVGWKPLYDHQGREDGRAVVGWISVKTATPPEDTPVWCLTKGDGIFIGGYVYIDEGWVWTNCYTSIYHTLKDGAWKWEANDFEYDDEYEVVAWMPLPSPPAALEAE